jgi:predicted dehydrogenase
MHRDVMIKAARAGKHIFTEKVMAPTVAECEEIAAEIRENHVNFVISLPQRTFAFTQYAKNLVESGELGFISVVRIRNGHNGVTGGWLPKYWFNKDEAAGGAMLDLGCHPVYIAPYLLGKPVRVSSMMTENYGTGVDEAAVATIEFENKSVAIVETSFITFDTPGSFEIYGSKGTLLANGGEIKLRTETTNGWITPEMPSSLPMPIPMFVDACLNESPIIQGFGVEDAITLTRIMESAYISDKQNKTVLL